MAQHHDPAKARRAATDVARRLQEVGHTAYFAGGCVRDELLGLQPTDFDVATDAPPNRVRDLFKKTAAVGVSFGVVLVRDFGPSIEVATFRAEGPYTDKRRPDHVTFATAEEDAQRRDFTINALFLDPLAAEDSPSIHGHVVDLVGGVQDLGAGLIRAVGDPDKRLDEDHLRALRAVRFAARFGFAIEPATRNAILRDARELAGVSRERIGDELRRMLDPRPHARHRPLAPAQAARELEELTLDAPALNEPATRSGAAILAALVEATPPTDIPGPLDPALTFADALAAWALDRHLIAALTTPDAFAVARRGVAARWRDALCLSNDERDRFAAVLSLVADLAAASSPSFWPNRPVAARKWIAAAPAFLPALRLLAAAARAHPAAGLPPGDPILANVRELAADGIGLAPPPLVTGDDLVAAGLQPGPQFKGILDAVYDEQLEGRVRTPQQALAAARARSPGTP